MGRLAVRPAEGMAAAPLPVPLGRTRAPVAICALTAVLLATGWPMIRSTMRPLIVPPIPRPVAVLPSMAQSATHSSMACPVIVLSRICPPTPRPLAVFPLTVPLTIRPTTALLMLMVVVCRRWCASMWRGCVVRRWRGMRSCGRGGSTRTRGLLWMRGRVGGWARAP